MNLTSDMRTVVIVGGGFCGTMAAVNLARFTSRPIRVVVVNADRPFGRGTAYGTERPEHLLNVAARNMSVFPDCPEHFLDWLQTRSEYAQTPIETLREMFIPRMIFGDYVRAVALMYLGSPHPESKIHFERVDDLAVNLSVDQESTSASQRPMTVMLASGQKIEADSVLLATGNPPPATPPSHPSLRHDSRYCANSWESWIDRLPAPGGRIVLLGTGLTMVDAVITLGELNWKGSIVAVSRSGTLPQSHFRGVVYPDYLAEHDGPRDLKTMVGLVKQNCERLQRMSQNPAIAVDKLRPYTQELWRGLTYDDKQTFLTQYVSRWNVLRHRIAQTIHQKVTDAMDTGQLKIEAARIDRLEGSDNGIDVWVTRADGNASVIQGDLVLNCTGPHAQFTRTESELYQNLMHHGVICADELDLGLKASDGFAVIDANNVVSRCLWAIGPMLKGSLWETIAVPELRVQAMNVAQRMLNQSPVYRQQDDVIEYCI